MAKNFKIHILIMLSAFVLLVAVHATATDSLVTSKSAASPASIDMTSLKAIEKKYQKSKTIQMDVVKKLKIQLLNKEKISEGSIKINKTGNFKLTILKPDHQEVILTPKNVWVIDFPMDPKDKMSVLKSKKPKKNQSPAVVAFLMGKGELSKNFKIIESKSDGGVLKIKLQAISKTEMVQNLNMNLDKTAQLITWMSFKDALGNETELEFKNIEFDVTFNKKEFDFTPPKNSSVSVID